MRPGGALLGDQLVGRLLAGAGDWLRSPAADVRARASLLRLHRPRRQLAVQRRRPAPGRAAHDVSGPHAGPTGCRGHRLARRAEELRRDQGRGDARLESAAGRDDVLESRAAVEAVLLQRPRSENRQSLHGPLRHRRQETREGVPLRRDAGGERRRQAGRRSIRGHQLRANGAAAAGDGLSRRVGLDRRGESSAGRRAVRRRCEDGNAEADCVVPADARCAHRESIRTSTTARCS